MSEQDSQQSKYRIEINDAQGVAIGDYARFEQHVHIAPPSPPPASREELLAAIRRASAELRAYPKNIAGIPNTHIDRAEVTQIVEWALNADPKDRLGMLLDQPGGGKTVVMRDVLEQLEAGNTPVLAIKADSLSGVKNRADLADRLGLPAPVEECALHLASEGAFIILLDQLDALSLTLSRDQAALDVMLSTLSRLRDINGLRIVASCRTFDLKNDPRLSTIKPDREFQLQPLEDSQVNRILQTIGVDSAHLLPAHRALLRTPLHLDIYARVVLPQAPNTVSQKQGYPLESFRTLQELYEALWQKRIEAVLPDTPPPTNRVKAIYALVESMQSNRQLVAPVAVLDEHTEAANYLERIGFIRREKSNWLFFHQTMFDYCYARRFVAQGRSLSQEILSGPQGLFERSQMVQVLAYLRGTNEAAYRRELTSLLFAHTLRVHLRLLLVGWFGSLPNPTVDELRIAHQLIKDADDRARFLQATGDNEGWFDLLNDDVLPVLLRSDDAELDRVVIPYFGTLIKHRTDAVLNRLHPYLAQSDAWDERIAYCLSRLDDWHNDKALDVLCDLFRRGRSAGWARHCLPGLAKSNPAAGCKALRAYLDKRLDDLLVQTPTKGNDSFSWGRHLLGEFGVGEIVKAALAHCSEKIIEHLLPWFVRATVALTESTDSKEHYPIDPVFSWGWHGEHISEGAAFAGWIVRAVEQLARMQPSKFRALAKELTKTESMAIQRTLASAYLVNPLNFADDIFEFLTGDVRRLNIGEWLEGLQYDSSRLFSAVFQYVVEEKRVVLERMILQLEPDWERRERGRRGLTQLRFLKSLPAELLSMQGRARLDELERKFPDFRLSEPQGIRFRAVGAPIPDDAQAKMSDEAWLGAMRKYDDATAWDAPREHPLKGGVIELSRAFAVQVKKDPARFYRLAQRFDETISLFYVEAAISALAESDVPAEWAFDLTRQFAPRIEGEHRRGICRSMEKRAAAQVPDDLLDLMTDWALHDPNPTEELWRTSASDGQPYYGGDPHFHGINTNRGAAVQAVCHCALSRKPSQVERAFRLLEQATPDPSTAVRTCVIESLGPLLREDDNRALTIFEQTLHGHPRLLQTPLVHRFLYWTYHRHFTRIRHLIEALLNDSDDATREAGALLACLAAFEYTEANDLVEQIMHGDTAIRKGAAQVYARNLEDSKLEAVCEEKLRQLMYDADEQVRAHVGECFEHLRAEHLNRLRSFIEEFLISPSLLGSAEHLIKYVKTLAADEHDLALRVTTSVLDAAGNEVVDIRTSRALLEQDLVQMPLTVYTHSVDPTTKSRAMDVFEQLLILDSRVAYEALADWDRR
jgi:hypothetical protein